MDKLWSLSEIDIFQDLSEEELKIIADRAPMQTVEAGTVFFAPDERTEVLFILKSGRVRIFRLSPEGKAFTTAIVSAGTIFGEMTLVGQHMHDNFAEALDSCVICLMSNEDVRRLLLSDPRIAARIAETLGRRLIDMEQRLSDFAFKSVPQRVAGTLLTIARSDQSRQVWPFGKQRTEVRVTHEQLAEFVGTYRETVTKILNELRDQGLIELRRGKIALLDTTALAAVAEE
ncbi:MAG: Crp/Fnr family transcriptional regulator [Chloroflexaceae bacterium]